MSASDLTHILIGTAGHIDHGKTRLVGRLTEIDTDRLPEEKARGISIDLGFAHWQAEGFQFGIIDVPGHERFVKNMVAGATGVNVALLVVAADDSVMPQTREHLEIMDLLGIEAGVIAVTKIDLVEEDFVELVEAEVEEVVTGTFLEGCPIVPVSSETGEGIESLKETLLEVSRQVTLAEQEPVFRMPVDRAISLPGHGTIVTGSVVSGEVRAGDTLELWPEGREVRVRSVQNHGADSADAGARQRTAINLAGVKNDEVSRGVELATVGLLQPTRRLLVDLKLLSSSPLQLKDRMELNLHIGTREVPARVILKGRQLKPGERAYAELRLAEEIVAAHGQRYILRRVSPALTVAGGRVLDPWLPLGKRVRDLQLAGEALDQPGERDRLSGLVATLDDIPETPLAARWRAGVGSRRYMELLEELKDDGTIVTVGPVDRPVAVHRERLTGLAGSVMKTIREELQRQQPRRTLPRATVVASCREIMRPALLEAVLSYLADSGELVTAAGNLGPADAQVQLTKAQRAARDGMIEQIQVGGMTPPTVKELAEELGQAKDQVQSLLRLCVEDGLAVAVSEDLFFAPEAIEQGRDICQDVLEQQGEATMSQLREAWGISRKFAVPLCEHFDQAEITIRRGDVRVPGPKLAIPLG
ncbi:MAG: selenocysteine-specific translation elongation factor [Planctomycetaceae bacterium]|jgi:selenocysteine-specific elongation factor|nr:selenocysteine-specific translation elongation factor [Planctomycetaceae bacterium]